MNNLMGEKVIVSGEVPHFMPEFKNPIYKFAVQQRLALRTEAIERLKRGEVSNGVATLLQIVAPLSMAEYDLITGCWVDMGEYLLHEYYGHALAFNNVEEARMIDANLRFGQNKNEGGGRK